MFYPLQLKPIFKERIWGGTTLLELFSGYSQTSTKVGELWAVVDHPPDSSVIANGKWAGNTLGQLLAQFPLELTGSCNNAGFPWLIKFIAARDKLSVQVHPDQGCAALFPGDQSKAEIWYVLKAGPKAEIVYGLKCGVDRQVFTDAIHRGQVLKCLNRVKVKPGDVFYIPPGLIHALGSDLVVAEIQENSDTTYRVFDYDRLDAEGNPRDLHINKALDAIDFTLHPTKNTLAIPFDSRFFRVDSLNIGPNETARLPGKLLQALLVLDGQGKITYNGETLLVQAGDAIVIPYALNGVELLGSMQVLRSRPGIKVVNRRINRRGFRADNQSIPTGNDSRFAGFD